MASSHLSKSEYERLAEFRYALRRYFRFSERAARAHGLKPQQYQALLALEGFPGRNRLTIGELAQQLQITHHSAVGLVDRMVSLSLVERSPCEEDLRRVYVSNTPAGRAILGKLYTVHRAELQTAGPRLINLIQQAVHAMPNESAKAPLLEVP